MKKRNAVYAASLDPITNGHINVIERMAPLYDELVVLVAVDSRKTYTFTTEERVDMAKKAVAHLPNVAVNVSIGCYVVKRAESLGAQVIIRGLRNFKDLEDEQTLAEENRRICPSVETIWIPCRPELMHVSSSMVKGHVGIDPEWMEQVSRSVPASVVVMLKKRFIQTKARKHWADLMDKLGNPEESASVLQDLLDRYNEPHRAYHNLEHIVTMLDTLWQIPENTPALALAVWFHDAVYNTRAKDNEERSAALASESIQKLGLSEKLCAQVTDLILATKHSVVPDNQSAKVLVDLDLIVLGSDQKKYNEYEEGIRQEYNWVPEQDFVSGRCTILQAFLDRPSIFTTQAFREIHESVARNNLERSIEKLKK